MTSRTLQKPLCLAVLLLGTSSIHAQSQDSQEIQTMENAKIHATIETNNAAVAAGDIEGALATFEPHAVLIGQPGMPAMGTPALRGAFEQFMVIAPKITITGHEVIQAGDIALHQSTWKMSGKAPDGNAFEQSGFSAVVLRKQPDGRWLMVIDNPFGDNLLRKK
jgi:uncharacterized protein (TIGR02246 family)